MNVQRLADKIHSKMVRCFRKTGKTMFYGPEWLEAFPRVPSETVYAAIVLLSADGRISVLFAEGIPQDMALNTNRIPKSAEVFRKFYQIVKEIRSWL